MKNILFFLLFFITLMQATILSSYALTPTVSETIAPTEKPSSTSEPKNINILNDLKNKIASKVAQLNLVQRAGLIGTVDAIAGTQITVLDLGDQQHFVDVDELTKFSSPNDKTAFGLSDLTKGATIDILGLYNKQSKRILARFINVVTIPRFLQGEIASIDGTNFVAQVIAENGKMTPVDIENVTKTFVYSKEDGLQKAGFSKIAVGKQVVVIGYKDKKDAKRIIASRILLFPDVAPNPRIIIPQEALSPDTTVTPSTGSGKKLTPITR